MLEFKKKESTDVYIYQLQESDRTTDVKIVFIDGVFSYCSYPMKGEYTRTGWKVLKEIEEAIAELEEKFIPIRKQKERP